MASSYMPEFEQGVSSSTDDSPMDTETFPVCSRGHLLTMGTPENCWTCRRDEQDQRRSVEGRKIEMYCLYLECRLGNEEMMGILQQLEEDGEAGGPLFLACKSVLQAGNNCHRLMEAQLREWMDPVQDSQVSSSSGPDARPAAASAEEDLKGPYHGFNMIKRGEGYHCLCGGRFKTDADLVCHLKNAMVYNSGSAVCICSVCGEMRLTCGGLRVHSRIDHQEMMERLWQSA